jgi:hypothetical protein
VLPAATSEEKGEKGKGLDDAEAKEVLRVFAAVSDAEADAEQRLMYDAPGQSCEEAGGILTRPSVPLW